MSVLEGPLLVISALLALAGAYKLIDPGPTAGALRIVHLRTPAAAVRVLGAVEIVVGTAALLTGARPIVALVAAFYLAFATFVVLALATDAPLQSCGCFGRLDTPPTAVHVVVNVTAAAVAAAASASSPSSFADVLATQPWRGAPMLLLIAVCTYLSVLVLSVLPMTIAAARNR